MNRAHACKPWSYITQVALHKSYMSRLSIGRSSIYKRLYKYIYHKYSINIQTVQYN